MAPVNVFSSTTTQPAVAESQSEEAPFSALTTAGESLFMCSTKEGHTCYHACRGHGRYPLWSDDQFMVDDVDEEEEEEMEQKNHDESSDCDIDEEEDWLSEEDSELDFWARIQESVARHRVQQQGRIHYSATDLRFLDENHDSSAAESGSNRGPIVGVIATKPPPEYVWHLMEVGDAWMRGSLPERLSDQPEGGYLKYRYDVWDRIPNSDIRDSDEDSSEEEEIAESRSWSELADLQELDQQEQSLW